MSETKRKLKAMNRISELTKQRDDLLAACKIGLAYIHAEISGVPRPINDLQDDKEILKSAIDSCIDKEIEE